VAVVAYSLHPQAGSGLIAQEVMRLYVEVQFAVQGSVGSKGGNCGVSCARIAGTKRSAPVRTNASILIEIEIELKEGILDVGCWMWGHDRLISTSLDLFRENRSDAGVWCLGV
jgi:hypothetical protein